ncbi:phosphoenolpyruvate carboxykinase (ATP) [bacterium]|nr:phosphoenolpyruvate carboxykinase (ATP) [bacterium]
MTMTTTISEMLTAHANCKKNLARKELIQQSVDHDRVTKLRTGALSSWTPPESTGRSPKDTYVVDTPAVTNHLDWNSTNNIPLSEESFEMLWNDAIALLATKEVIFETDRVIGADSKYALPVKTVADKALTALFTDNMFRPEPKDIANSVFADKPFTLLVLPDDKLDASRYEGHLRTSLDGSTSTMAVAMNFDGRRGVVFGSAYLGSVKKLMFTVMNYYLPEQGILPLHCSANEGKNGDSALLLGLSGTGKTTLSADPERALLGDDEHGWSSDGIANFENGCYAKLIDLNPQKEPEIFNAVFHKDDYLNHGAIVENCMIYPNGNIDFSDDRLTPNSRASYPLTFLSNVKESSTSVHPKTILFLTADANSILPPIAKLSRDQAMLWFLMGYTSKLAGTETGVTEPISTFSRFFGGPFMPRNPRDYTDLFGKKMDEHKVNVYLVNTGWTGGTYGVGSRIDITITRMIVSAALSGALENVEYHEDSLFHISVPKTCPGGATNKILNPIDTWNDKEAFNVRAQKLASDFSAHFDKAYGKSDIPASVKNMCPGK